MLWFGAWIGAAAAASWMVLLIAARVVHDHLQVGRATKRESIIQAYLALMRPDGGGLDALYPHRRRTSLMVEALLNVLDVVRGGERERLIDNLRAFGFDRMLLIQARRGGQTSRLAAIEALAAFPGQDTEAALRRATGRPGAELRLAAVKSLLSIGARVDLSSLVAEMQRRRDPWSGSLTDTFKLLAEHQPGDCAAAFARTDLPISVRVMLAEALGDSGDYTSLPVLSEAAMGDSPRTRAASIRALGRLMHPASEPVLARGAVDEDWRVRAASAIAIGDAGLTTLIPRLTVQLSDAIWWVRFQAAEALARLGPPGESALRHAAMSGDDEAAKVASLTLVERGLS